MASADPSTASVGARPERPKRRNFIRRYWRGEMALGPSYWLVYVLLSLVVTQMITTLQQRILLGTSYDPPAGLRPDVVVCSKPIALGLRS